MRPTLLLGTLALLAGCASEPVTPPPAADAQAWHARSLPGKPLTRYEWTEKDGRAALQATSERSASLWRRQLDPVRPRAGEVAFSWWVPDLMPTASVADADREDAVARVIFGFDGDVAKLPMATRMKFELAQTLTGEEPPYAVLMYVWDAALPVGTVVVSPRSDRVRKIVVDSGPDGLRRWRDHRRDLAADFRLAFGEAPGPLKSIAVMTDSDNTRSSSRAWYGAVELAD